MQAGILSCTIHPGADKHATCVFEHQAGANSFSETYDTKLMLSLTDERDRAAHTLHWAVFTPGGKANPGGMLLGARLIDSLEETTAGDARVDVAFVNDGQRIRFRPIDGSSGAISKTELELMPSPEPVALPSKKSLKLTIMR
jgi:hypothetical protein